MAKLFIVDDHQIVVEGLRSLLNDEPEYTIVGSCNRPLEVEGILERCDVDVLLTDINMPEMTGVELTRLVRRRFPKIKILALSMFGDHQIIKEMIDAGISGYILKNTGKSELMEALKKIANGQSFFCEEVTKEMMKALKNDDSSGGHLTNREVEIIRLIEKELSNKKIADLLFISERTVETHRKNIFRKSGTQSVIGLLKFAYDRKLI